MDGVLDNPNGVMVLATSRGRLGVVRRFWRRASGMLRGLLWMRAATASTPKEVEDAELVARVRKGGPGAEQAYDVLIRRHQDWVYRFVYYLVGIRSDSEDVTQEVFLKVYLSLDTYRQEASFKGWLRTVAMRTAFNWQRDRGTARRYTDAAGEAQQVAGADRTRAQQDKAFEAREIIASLLGKLPYAYREILILRHLEEMSVQDIANSLQIGKSAAKMRLKRAREQFEELYSQEVGDVATTRF